MLEKPVDKESFNLLELGEEIIELLVVVFLYSMHFLAHRAEFADLVLHLVLELAYFATQVFHAKLLKHDNLVVSVLA